MHGRDDDLRVLRLHRLSALLRHLERLPEQRLRRRGAKADDDARLDQRDLELEPGVAGRDLADVRLLVNPTLTALGALPLEVLHRIGDIDGAAIDAGLDEGVVEELARRPDERLARSVLLVAWLLADEHDVGCARAFAEDGLGADLPEMTAAAAFRRRARPG